MAATMGEWMGEGGRSRSRCLLVYDMTWHGIIEGTVFTGKWEPEGEKDMLQLRCVLQWHKRLLFGRPSEYSTRMLHSG